MGIQKKEKCSRIGQELQISTGSQRLSQIEGVDFAEILSPVAKLTSVRLLMSLATKFDLEIEKMDMKTTFLHGNLEEEIYMK